MVILAWFLCFAFDEQLFHTGFGFWQWIVLGIAAFGLED